MLTEKGEDIKWYVLGDGDQRKQLEALIKKYGLEDRFILPGVVDNPYPYIKQCDIYVHASRYEGKSIAIREAQVLGKPIVVSDCRSNLEQVTDNEDALVSSLDSEILCGKISSLLHNENLCKELSLNASKRYLKTSDDIKKLFSLLD